MTQNRLFIMLFQILSLTFLIFAGCTPTPTINLPDLSSDIIRTYKTVRVYANNPSAKKTGVYVEVGDFYSFIASGNVTTSLNNRPYVGYDGLTPQQRMGLIIDKQYVSIPPINGTMDAQSKGEIRLYVKDKGFIRIFGYAPDPRYYRDNSGSFEVTIIVWKTKNLDHIVDFFKQLTILNPDDDYAKQLLFQARGIRTFKTSYPKDTEIASEFEMNIQGLFAAEELAGLEQAKVNDTASSSNEFKVSSPNHQPKAAVIKEKLVTYQDSFNESVSKSEVQIEAIPKINIDSKTATIAKDHYSPLMLIISPREEQTITTVTIQLIGVVEDNKGLETVEITINDKPISPTHDRGINISANEPTRRYEFNESIPVDIGSNRINIHAKDLSGNVSEKTIVVNRKELRRKVWAVVVGVDKYPHLPHLKYAVKDAQAFYNLLLDTNLVSSENIFLLTDNQAKLNNLRSILGTKLKQNAGQDDMVLIYFAGHGANEKDSISPDGDGLEKYLLPYDTDPEDLYATALPMREISHILNRIKADRLVFIADACYSGASGGRTVITDNVRANISDAFIDRIASGKGRVIMTASGPNEVSVEDDALEHGVFTYYLLEAMKGKADYDSDGLVTVDEGYRYVSEEVPRATGQEQHPMKKGAVEGQLILGVVD